MYAEDKINQSETWIYPTSAILFMRWLRPLHFPVLSYKLKSVNWHLSKCTNLTLSPKKFLKALYIYTGVSTYSGQLDLCSGWSGAVLGVLCHQISWTYKNVKGVTVPTQTGVELIGGSERCRSSTDCTHLHPLIRHLFWQNKLGHICGGPWVWRAFKRF